MLLVPPADLEVVGFGRCYAGQPVEVPSEFAGETPDPRYEEAMRELNDAILAVDHTRAQSLRDELSTLNMGRGLLAQGWRLATPADTDQPNPAAASGRGGRGSSKTDQEPTPSADDKE